MHYYEKESVHELLEARRQEGKGGGEGNFILRLRIERIERSVRQLARANSPASLEEAWEIAEPIARQRAWQRIHDGTGTFSREDLEELVAEAWQPTAEAFAKCIEGKVNDFAPYVSRAIQFHLLDVAGRRRAVLSREVDAERTDEETATVDDDDRILVRQVLDAVKRDPHGDVILRNALGQPLSTTERKKKERAIKRIRAALGEGPGRGRHSENPSRFSLSLRGDSVTPGSRLGHERTRDGDA